MFLSMFGFAAAFVSCASGKTIKPEENTNKITQQEWLEKNKNSPVLREGNGKVYKLKLANVLEPGSVILNPAPSGDSASLEGLTRQINASFEKEYTEDQIKQIYFMSKEQDVNITEIIDNSVIDQNGNIIYNKNPEIK